MFFFIITLIMSNNYFHLWNDFWFNVSPLNQSSVVCVIICSTETVEKNPLVLLFCTLQTGSGRVLLWRDPPQTLKFSGLPGSYSRWRTWCTSLLLYRPFCGGNTSHSQLMDYCRHISYLCCVKTKWIHNNLSSSSRRWGHERHQNCHKCSRTESDTWRQHCSCRPGPWPRPPWLRLNAPQTPTGRKRQENSDWTHRIFLQDVNDFVFNPPQRQNQTWHSKASNISVVSTIIRLFSFFRIFEQETTIISVTDRYCYRYWRHQTKTCNNRSKQKMEPADVNSSAKILLNISFSVLLTLKVLLWEIKLLVFIGLRTV